MKVKVYPIISSLHVAHIGDDIKNMLAPLEAAGINFEFVDTPDKLYKDCDMSVILVQSGGSENLFLKAFGDLKEPYYLLTYGTNNSLAASLEIMHFINKHGMKGEVLHGDSQYLISRFQALGTKKEHAPAKYRLGIFGHPSDWLISCDVDREKVREVFDVDLVDVNMNEIVDLYEKEPEELDPKFENSGFDRKEMVKAYRLYKALEKTVAKYNLNGFTIRCFDLLTSIGTTACLGLALFNATNDKIAACEGDVPAMLAMFLAKNELGLPAFQANPSRIDVSKGQIVLAHCTLPLNMCDGYKFETHYESGIGVSLRGNVPTGDVTVFRIDSTMSEFFVEDGYLEKDLTEQHLCRTQVVIDLPHLDKVLTHPMGNHEMILRGHNADKITAILEAKGLKRVQ